LMRPLLRQGEQWLLEPVRPGEAAIPLDLEVFDRSGLFGVVVHAVHHLGKLSSDIRNWSSGDTKSGPPCGA